MEDFRRACRTGHLPGHQQTAEFHKDWLTQQEVRLRRTLPAHAVSAGQTDAAQLLLEHGLSPAADMKPSEASLFEDSAMVQFAHGPNFRQNDTPLHCAGTHITTEVTKTDSANSTMKNSTNNQIAADLSRDLSAFEFLPARSTDIEEKKLFTAFSSPVTLATEEDPLLEWLCHHKLESTYNILYDNGFEDLHTLSTAVRDKVLSLDVLAQLGVLPAQRRLLLLAFETAASEKVADFVLRPSLKSWLAAMHLPQLLENFTAAGFADLDELVTVMESNYALSERVLKKELGIAKLGHRHRVLMKLTQLVNETHQLGCNPHSGCSGCGVF